MLNVQVKPFLSGMLMTLVMVASSGSSQDSVIYQPSKNEQPLTRKGTIVEYDAKFLTLKLEKIERKIPTEQVRRIETKWVAEHLEADQQKKKHQFQAALKLYAEAYTNEPRAWARRLILAQMVQCYRESEQWIEAAKQFHKLVELEDQTRFFDQIPLAWNTPRPNAGVTAQAKQWLESDDEHLALIAASLLMSAADRATAMDQLQELTRSRDSRIAQLATMQIWRSRSITVAIQEITAWQTRIEKIPEAYRAGGYFVIGNALAHHKQDAQAATTLLRIPILYPGQHQLAATALHQAAKLIQKSNPTGANQLFRELASQYADTAGGKEARAILQKAAGK